MKPWEMNWNSQSSEEPDDGEEFRESIIEQESGGAYDGPDGMAYLKKDGSRARDDMGEIALGKYQVVPKFWFEKIGLDPLSAQDRQTFRSTPWLQDKAFKIVIADGEARYPGDRRKQAAAYYGGAGAANVLGTAAGDKPQGDGLPSINQYTTSVMGRVGGGELPPSPTPTSEAKPWEMNWGQSTQDQVALAPSMEPFGTAPGKIDMNQPQPVAKDLPALQPALPVAGPELPPPEQPPIPYMAQGQLGPNQQQITPPMGSYQPTAKPTAQENLQAMGDRQPISNLEFGSAFAKGAAGGAVPGMNIPMTAREQQSGGQFLGAVGGGLLPAAAGPMAIPAMMAVSGLGAVARGMDKEGQVQNPMEVGIQAALGGILGKLPAAVGQSLGAKIATGAGIGGLQGYVQESANRMMQDGRVTQADLQNPEVWKQIASSALTGMMFGAVGGKAPEIKEFRHAQEQAPAPKDPERPFWDQTSATGKMGFQEYDPSAPIPVKGEPQVPPQPTRADRLGEAVKEAGGEGVWNSVTPEQLAHFEKMLGPALGKGKNLEYRVEEPAPEQKATEPWQMTKAKYHALLEAAGPEVSKGSKPHIDLVKEAIEKKMEIPPEVLAEYPHLNPKHTEEDLVVPENVIHVGEYVRKALIGADGRTIHLNPRDMKKYGLKEGQSLDPEDMAQNDMTRNIGGFLKVDPNARTLDDIAHELNTKIMVRKEGEELRVNPNIHIVGHDKPADAYGFSADDVMTAFINRPRDRKILKAEIEKATKKTAEYDTEAMEAYNRMSPEDQKAEMARLETENRGRFEPNDDEHLIDYLHQKEDQKPTFYSQLSRVVNDKMPNAMGPETLKNMLKANAVKDEEIKWTGLDDFLKGKEKVTKKEIQDHLDQNQVEIKEVTKKPQGSPNDWGESRSKFDQYQEPGGKNYRELLLTLPAKSGWVEEGSSKHAESEANFHSSHWDEPNVLAHVRFNDRTTPDGKKVLHLEEVQSDWHQQGRKQGYKDGVPKATGWEATGQIGAGSEVPDAPFKKTWHEMALRRMLRYAAENGYDYLTWTGGEKQAARYDLSKHVDTIMYSKEGDRYYVGAYKDGVEKFGYDERDGITEQQLSDTFGKEIAEKIIRDEGKAIPGGSEKELSGLDLKVGGEGMKGFYDKILPDYLRKYGKKWGAGVEKIRVGEEARAEKYNAYGDIIRQRGGEKSAPLEAQGIPITPEMKASVMEGQPLFQQHRGSFTRDKDSGKYIITLVKGKTNLSTLFHEHFHFLEQSGAIAKADRETLTQILEKHGVKDPVNKKTGAFKAAGAEKLADWFERYLRDGVTQVEELKPIFEKIKAWMRQVYQSVKGTRLDDDVPGDVKGIYDRLLNKGRGEDKRLRPEDVARAQEEVLHQPEDTGKPQVGPKAQKSEERFDKLMKSEGLEGRVNYDGQKQTAKSGYQSDKDRWYTEHVNEAEPLEQVQRWAEQDLGRKLKPHESIRFAINRVLGAGGRANVYIKDNLFPIFQGGVKDGVRYEKLNPAEGRLVDAYALSRDALWRYNNSEGYNDSVLPRETAQKLLDLHAKLDPKTKFKVEQAAQGLVTYAKDLARRKMEARLPDWTPENFAKITANPHYVPEIRDWESVLAKPFGQGKRRQFTSVNRLIRGNFDTGEVVPIFDPVTSLIHDTHEFEAEAAKMSLWNNVIELTKEVPRLRDWIKRMPKGYKAQNFEGEIPILRPRDTYLDVNQIKVAEGYEEAQAFLARAKDQERDRRWMEQHLIRVHERINKMPGDRRAMMGQDMDQVLKDVQRRHEQWLERKKAEAEKTIADFKKLPEAEQNLIEDYIEEGKPQIWLVPKELAEAVNGMKPTEFGSMEKIIVQVASLFRRFQVGYNLDFSGANVPRDLQESFINAKVPPQYALKGFMHFVKKDAVYKAFMEEGGSMEGDESGMRQSSTLARDVRYGDRFFKDRYKRVMDDAPWKDKKIVALGREVPMGGLARGAEALKQTGMIPLEAAEMASEAGEMMTRLGVMDWAMKKGMSPAEAADLARSATLDFKRIGSKMKNWNARIPFLNARIQGVDRSIRTIKQDPKGAALRIAIAAVAPTVLLQAWNMQNENYVNIPAWEKEYYWIMMDPKGPGYTKVAKGHIAQFFINPMQMMFENWTGTADVSAWHIARTMAASGLPVSETTALLSPAEKLLAEEAANYDYYAERPIVRASGKEPMDQYDPNTPETLKKLGRAFNWSPQRMQHISRTLMGGTSGNILFFTDLMMGKGPKDVGGTPIARRFRGKAEEWKSDLAEQKRKLLHEKTLKDEALKVFKSDYMKAGKDSTTAKENRKELLDGMRRTMKGKMEIARKLGDSDSALSEIKKALKALDSADVSGVP